RVLFRSAACGSRPRADGERLDCSAFRSPRPAFTAAALQWHATTGTGAPQWPAATCAATSTTRLSGSPWPTATTAPTTPSNAPSTHSRLPATTVVAGSSATARKATAASSAAPIAPHMPASMASRTAPDRPLLRPVLRGHDVAPFEPAQHRQYGEGQRGHGEAQRQVAETHGDALDAIALAAGEDGSGADEGDAGHDCLDQPQRIDAQPRAGIVVVLEHHPAQTEQQGRGSGHQHVGTEPGRSILQLALVTDGSAQRHRVDDGRQHPQLFDPFHAAHDCQTAGYAP